MSHVTHSYRVCEWVKSDMWTGHVAHVSKSCHTSQWVMSYIWTWLIHMYIWTWLIHSFARLHFYVCSFSYGWVMSHIWMSHVTHMNDACHPYEWVMLLNESCHRWHKLFLPFPPWLHLVAYACVCVCVCVFVCVWETESVCFGSIPSMATSGNVCVCMCMCVCVCVCLCERESERVLSSVPSMATSGSVCV